MSARLRIDVEEAKSVWRHAYVPAIAAALVTGLTAVDPELIKDPTIRLVVIVVTAPIIRFLTKWVPKTS